MCGANTPLTARWWRSVGPAQQQGPACLGEDPEAVSLMAEVGARRHKTVLHEPGLARGRCTDTRQHVGSMFLSLLIHSKTLTLVLQCRPATEPPHTGPSPIVSVALLWHRAQTRPTPREDRGGVLSLSPRKPCNPLLKTARPDTEIISPDL